MLFQHLNQNLDKDFSSFPTRRLALLGDSSTQFLARAIRAYGYEERFNFQVFEADFDQLDRQILDRGSELYASNPDYIILYPSAERLCNRFAIAPPAYKERISGQVLAEVQHWWEAIARHCQARIIHFNFIEINDAVFGNFAAKTASSFLYQIKKINFDLMTLAQSQKHAFIADVAGLSNQIGYASVHDPRLYATSKMAFALDFLPLVAKAVTDIIKAASGNLHKCLILDLDNTLWGGVIGDDGMENIQLGELGMGPAFDDLQLWARALKDRGIILAVCSKNDEQTAKQPFREHPDMILRLDDIAVFVANWNNKADNIKHIQQALNIGFDSMVYLDDSPFERNLVRELLPAVTVPELPDDPAMVVPHLRSLNLFETASLSKEDLQRTRQYQEEINRHDFQRTFTS